jgi:hypothetical protein
LPPGKISKYLAGKICHVAKLLKYWRETTRQNFKNIGGKRRRGVALRLHYMARRENEERNNFQFIGSPKPSPFTPGGLQQAPQLKLFNGQKVNRTCQGHVRGGGERGVIDSLPLKKAKSR